MTTCTAHDGRCLPVALYDGRPSCSWSEDWRHECEARHILNLPTRDDRRAWLADIQKLRGRSARERLEATILALHTARGKRR